MNEAAQFSPTQRAELCAIVRLGCDRRIACKYVGVALATLEAELERDAALARDLARAEADAELRHMGNVHKAAEDEKNWRTSVWWLEQRARQRRDAAATGDGLAALLDELARIIAEEVPDVPTQLRLIERLVAATRGADDGRAPATSAVEPASEPAAEEAHDR